MKHLLASLILALALTVSLADLSYAEPLTPIRSTIERSGYTIDAVGDKKQRPDSDTMRVLLRITHGDKTPIKPRDIVLIDPSGREIDPEDRDDKKVGDEENSGLPLLVSTGADSYGDTGVGLQVNLNQLFGPHGKYSYTKVAFRRADFATGHKLKITMPDHTQLIFGLDSIAE